MADAIEKPALSRGDWWVLGQCTFLSLGMAMLVLTVPIFMLQLYDRIIPSGNFDTLWLLAGLALALLALYGFLDQLRARLLSRIGVALELRAMAYAPIASRQSGDLDFLRAAAQSGAPAALLDLPGLPIFLVVLALLHPWLAVLGLLTGLVLLLVGWLAMPVRQASNRSPLPTDRLLDGLSTDWQSPLQFHALTRSVGHRAEQRLDDLGQLDRKHRVMAILKSLRLAAQLGCLALGGYLAMSSAMNAAGIVAATIVMSRALAPIEQLASGWPLLRQARQAWRRLRELPAEVSTPSPFVAADGVEVVLQKVAISPPGRELPVLRQIDLKLLPGTTLGVVGSGGVGKSALLRTIAGQWSPRLGDVRIAGSNPRQLSPEDRCRSVGLVEQEPSLVAGSIAENIASFRQHARAERIVAAAQTAGIHHSILAQSGGYGHMVEPGSQQLPAGLRIGIALAAALYDEPAVLLVDSPFNTLDNLAASRLRDVLAAWAGPDRVLVVTSHRLDDVRNAAHLIVLADGRIQAGGAQNDVVAWLHDRQSPALPTKRPMPRVAARGRQV